MKYQAPVGIVLTAIALMTTVPLANPFLSQLVAIADEIRTYGTDGTVGRHGRVGQAGTAGSPRTIRADGQPQQVYSAGSTGRDGEDGDVGDNPYCRSQPRYVEYDLQAPDGAAGGDGGNGGNGGDGGDVTIYYDTLANLRLITVDARGGEPGQGGRGGWGSDGCRCQDRDWEVEVCDGENCREERYICRDGNDGRSGRNGRNGERGNPGQLWLVNQTEPLLPETPTQTQTLETFMRQPVQLSKNVWQSRSGAVILLAAGSFVADIYQEYVGRAEGRAQIVWETPQSQAAFLGISATANIQESGNIQFQFPETTWVAGRRDQTEGLTTYTITRVVRAEEATRLAQGNVSGRGVDFTMAVVDLAATSDYLTTKFELDYKTAEGDPRDDRRVRYSTRYEGDIPEELVSRDNNRFVLAVGQLPLASRHLRRGTYVQAELRITRSLGENSATQTLDWEGRL